MYHLEVRGEICVPAIEADEESAGEDTSAKNGAVCEERKRYERFWSPDLFIYSEQDEEKAPEDDHADDES